MCLLRLTVRCPLSCLDIEGNPHHMLERCWLYASRPPNCEPSNLLFFTYDPITVILLWRQKMDIEYHSLVLLIFFFKKKWLSFKISLDLQHFPISLFLCVWMFSLQVCLCTTCTQCLKKAEEGVGSLGTDVIDNWEPRVVTGN